LNPLTRARIVTAHRSTLRSSADSRCSGSGQGADSHRAAAAVGAPDSVKGEALICFCVLKPGANKHVDLAGELKKKVATELGKALAPRDVLFAADLPKTRNAKNAAPFDSLSPESSPSPATRPCRSRPLGSIDRNRPRLLHCR
jgi:acyl-CoA synthetase (AMP-forming)/AMP-acid ligase II